MYPIEFAQQVVLSNAIEAGLARRIDWACFTDGNEGEFRVEFWRMLTTGDIYRTCYNGRTTVTTWSKITDVEILERFNQGGI